MGNSNHFAFTGQQRRVFIGLLVVGVLAAVAGLLINQEISMQRVWANFLVNTIFFLGISLLGLFFVATHTMAYGGWHILVRRIPEALSTFIPVGVGLLGIVVAGTLFGGHHLYHWTDTFITQDTVTVGELRAYEEDLMHHHGAGHGEDHGDDHDGEHGEHHEEDDAHAALSHGAQGNGRTLLASLSQDDDQLHGGDGHDGSAHGADSATDDGHADDHAASGESHSQSDGDGHGSQAHGAAHGQAHDDHNHSALDEEGVQWGGEHGMDVGHDAEHLAHGMEGDYVWYSGKVSDQAEAHHGQEYYAAQFAGQAEDTRIENPHFDTLIAHKKGFLNKGFFGIRFLVYALIWIGCFYAIRRASVREDKEGGLKWYNNSRKWSAAFMVLFGITSSTMAWDFLMSIDSHWFSTMYGWYNAASLWVACVAVTTLLLIYLKNQGYMPQANENHLHDLGKYLFGFSVFWTYLWFSQYMLIWYANLPEETMYFHARNGDPVYRTLFFVNLGMNFFVPLLVLITRNAKRKVALMTGMAASLVVTHWLDIFLEGMPGTVGDAWSIGLLEIGMLLAFAGLFLLVVFRGLAQASLVPQKHPFYLESVTHHT